MYKGSYEVKPDPTASDLLLEEGEIEEDDLKCDDHPAVVRGLMADKILPHIRVNAAADYYGLPRLSELSRVQIQSILDKEWSPDGFSTAFNEAFHATHDKALETVFASTVAVHIDELVDSSDFNSLQITDECARAVIRSMLEKSHALQSDLDMTQKALLNSQAATIKECARADLERASADSTRNAKARVVEVLRSTSNCRNCSNDFGCTIWDNENLVRCKICLCKHF